MTALAYDGGGWEDGFILDGLDDELADLRADRLVLRGERLDLQWLTGEARVTAWTEHGFTTSA